jgi:hypothetical protein
MGEIDTRSLPSPGETPSSASLLLLGEPAEVLARLVAEDPLAIRGRVGSRVLERRFLLDIEHVALRAQALCASQARTWRGVPALDAWLEARIDEAIASALQEEPDPATAGTLASFAEPLGLDPLALLRSCSRFNRLSLEEREAFLNIVLEGRAGAPPPRAERFLPERLRRLRTPLEVFGIVEPGTSADSR